MSIRMVALCVTVAATSAFAEGAATYTGQKIQLTCPAGTVQRGERIDKNMGVFCAKVGEQGSKGRPTLHGPYVDFWSNGQKQSEGQYQEGSRTGHWTFWDANGVKTGETTFTAGNYHGARVEFYSNGNKKLEQRWVNGKRDGVVVSYAQDGQKTAETAYKADRVVSEQRFENGQPVTAQ